MNDVKQSLGRFSRRCRFVFDPERRNSINYLVIGLFGCIGLLAGIMKGWALGGIGGVLVIAPLLLFLGCCLGALANLFLRNLMPILLVLIGLLVYLLSLYLFFQLWGLGK